MNQKNGRTDPGPLRERARSLFISQATIDETLEWATPRQLDAIDRMLATELANREASKRARLMRQARFPVPKSLDGYDFANVRLPDGYTKEQLTGLDFAAKAQDLVFYGKTGRGKTHLATALGMLAIEQGRSVRFRQTAELVLQPGKAKRDGALDSLLRDLARADLIILDEFGYAPVRLDGARLLYQIIAGSYERRSIILRHEHRVQQMGDDLRRRQTRRRDHRPHRPPRTPHRIHRPQPTRQPSPHVRQDGQPVKQTTGRHSSCRKPKKISDETRNTDLTKNRFRRLRACHHYPGTSPSVCRISAPGSNACAIRPVSPPVTACRRPPCAVWGFEPVGRLLPGAAGLAIAGPGIPVALGLAADRAGVASRRPGDGADRIARARPVGDRDVLLLIEVARVDPFGFVHGGTMPVHACPFVPPGGAGAPVAPYLAGALGDPDRMGGPGEVHALLVRQTHALLAPRRAHRLPRRIFDAVERPTAFPVTVFVSAAPGHLTLLAVGQVLQQSLELAHVYGVSSTFVERGVISAPYVLRDGISRRLRGRVDIDLNRMEYVVIRH